MKDCDGLTHCLFFPHRFELQIGLALLMDMYGQDVGRLLALDLHTNGWKWMEMDGDGWKETFEEYFVL